LKVLHVINTLSAGGAERHLLNLSRELRRRGVEVVIACLRETVPGSRSLRPEFEREGARVVDLEATDRFAWRFLARVPGLIQRERPDILHTHLPRADIGGVLWRRLGHLPWVCSVHDIHSASWDPTWAIPLVSRLWRRADHVIAISEAVSAWLEQECRVPAARTTAIHYGIETQPFQAPARPQARTLGPIIGVVGRLEPRKGHETLIRAMPAVLARFPNASLRIAGHDHQGYESTLKRLVAELSLGERVTFVGYEHDVPRFLADVDVFALASRAEGFGQAVIEAMASGLPVVVSKLAPFDEIVRDGQSGRLAEVDSPAAFAEAICAVAADPAAASRMSVAARQRVIDAFSVEEMTNRTLEIYRQVCPGASS
jgi:glycosyltransferase involved in cell wall biosynthesis